MKKLIVLGILLLALPTMSNISDKPKRHKKAVHVEKWMTIPFEESFKDESVEVEKWMTIPFDKEFLHENSIEVEEWMTVPFEESFKDESVEVEEWMTKSWS